LTTIRGPVLPRHTEPGQYEHSDSLKLSRKRLVTLCGQVVRLCSMWRSTRAAATMSPIFQGQSLTLRSALNVVFSKEFPRSPMARTPLWALLKAFWMSQS